jgi:transcriptional regulator with XRE-family HTH domain
VSAKRNPELGAFLHTRRSRLGPRDVGLPARGHRRVPGLRREELALLAGVSPDYYTRLEQGRQPTASPSVLDAVARALRLSAEERSHLYALAGEPEPSVSAPAAPGDTVDPRVRRVLDVLGDTPAILCGPYVDILTANAAARFLFTDFGALPPRERNAVRWMLLSPLAREIYRDQWENSAGEMVGMLRLDVGRSPDNPRVAEIVDELLDQSPLFRRLWTEHRVSAWQTDEKTLYHPVAGAMRFLNSSITVNGVPDQAIYLVVPDDVSAFEAALHASSGVRWTGRPENPG